MIEQFKELDALILAAASNEWQKTALVISKVFDDPAFDKDKATGQIIAMRIYELVDNKALVSTGNIRRWRDSNVKLAE